MQRNGRGRDDERARRPPLAIAFSQDPMRRRTRLERVLAHSVRPALTVLAAVLVAVLAVTIAAVRYVEAAFHPPRRAHAADAAARAAAFASQHHAALSSATVLGMDGAALRAWWFRPEPSSQGSVLLLHGFGDNRDAVLPLAGLLLDHKLRVLLPDLRAHGSSGGGETTWGVLEAADLAMWVEWIEEKHPDQCVFAFGSSLGATVLIQALPRIPLCGAIVEAPVESFAAREADDLVGWMHVSHGLAEILAAPIVSTSMMYARARYGVDLRRADALDAIAKSHVSVLVIENGADDTARRGLAERLRMANPRLTTTWIVAGAAHAQTWKASPREFPARVLAFLDHHR